MDGGPQTGILVSNAIPVGTLLLGAPAPSAPAGYVVVYTTSALGTAPSSAVWTTTAPPLNTVVRVGFFAAAGTLAAASTAGPFTFSVIITATDATDPIGTIADVFGTRFVGTDITDQMGDWFATHNRWLTDSSLGTADVQRITGILGEFKKELRVSNESSPAEDKIRTEIDRWSEAQPRISPKLVLKRGPETKAPPVPVVAKDTIALFDSKLERLTAIYKDYCQGKQHLLSVADDLLRAAKLQRNKDALILSAFIIYYLKQNGYKVEPYVKKLKEAETIQSKGALDA